MLYPVLQDPLRPVVSSLFDRPRGASIGQMLFRRWRAGRLVRRVRHEHAIPRRSRHYASHCGEQPVGRILR